MPAGPLSLVSRSPEETRELGAALGAALRPGDLVSLTGDLGAGKTALVQGAARALGVEEPVASPTFVLVREYRGRLPVYHVDVYRLDRLQEVRDLGWEDMLDGGGVVFVEWGSAIGPLLPPTYLEVSLTVPDADETRHLEVRGRGAGWSGRWEQVADRLQPWGAA
ncbi:MAG TPA: tRNA (adenosine(37)-N6)-threonylcarbamoyltransferase complex ATPase subunit type 1 TsaE [Actinomycetota bacterium]|nr:tRNA (adenosine(37)-N6)-threonylcarbamoyltransferase complex ATPase subunit type 1 TsaE [Actinomycetota bacterium]